MKTIETLRQRYEAATKGRWTQTSMDGPDSRFDYVHAENVWGQLGEEVAAITSGRDADAPHIAAAHNAHEALLRVAEAARDVVGDYADHEGPQTPAFARLRVALTELEQVQL